MQDGATFALVSQPAVLPVAPGTAAVNEVKNLGTVLLVQLLHLVQAGLHHLVVPRHVLVGTGGGIADKGVVEVLLAAL